MEYFGIVFRMAGGLGLFLYGMKVMSDGIQQAAGDRMQRVINFMTGNRFMAVLTGMVITAIVQSSSAVSVMMVSFVNAGLLTLSQSIGVTMGANIGTTVTAWLVSLIGFKINISTFALPAVGIGFILRAIRWKHQHLGEAVLGFGLLFLGLEFLTSSLPRIDAGSLSFISAVSGLGFLSVLIGVGVGTAVTALMNSSSASTAIIITLAFGGLINFDMSAAMILGANIGTTINAPLAAIGGTTAAKQAALVHVLFNVIGVIIALIFFRPFVTLVDYLTPGPREGAGITTHLAMFHTAFNMSMTILFLPFLKQFAVLVSVLVKETAPEPSKSYTFEYPLHNAPELAIVQAEKEIRDMAGLASSMYGKISAVLGSLHDAPDKERQVDTLVAELHERETTADEMREELTRFLITCTRQQLNQRSQRRVSQLLRIIADLEELSDECYSVSFLLERSVKKNLLFKHKEMEALTPYMGQVEASLGFVREHLGNPLTEDQIRYAGELEARIDKSRNKLRKLGRKRIEAGENVKTELLFIDLVRRLEKLGDYCFDISKALTGAK
ncbi:MAG: Na/Pi cotransporter family protein [Treponema sp.]|jgi:phosphate:Na+ symporter|nr:Na/Pi cotransporter family protein [Treponema sp.]